MDNTVRQMMGINVADLVQYLDTPTRKMVIYDYGSNRYYPIGACQQVEVDPVMGDAVPRSYVYGKSKETVEEWRARRERAIPCVQLIKSGAEL